MSPRPIRTVQAIFVHVPKTAGNCILGNLLAHDIKIFGTPHGKWPTAHRRFSDEEWLKAFRFTMMRNPWDRIVSYYHHSRRTYPEPTQPEQFAEWVWKHEGHLIDTSPGRALFDESGTLQVPNVFQYEKLHEALAHVCAQFGKPLKQVLVQNPGSRRREVGSRDWRGYYDPKTFDTVERLSRFEIERFGYTFDDPATPPPADWKCNS